tara:strand:+ start:1234 stop:3102 length:1869 start_codon:yes stop_codon:yes gene_type:complete
MRKKGIIKILLYLFSLGTLGILLFSAALNIYKSREAFMNVTGLGEKMARHNHSGPRFLINPLTPSNRNPPVKFLKDLIVEENAHLKGQWSAPIDWNVTSIHSLLLPDERVMTFGSFAISHKENSDIRANKKITLTDGRTLERDRGDEQWNAHEINIGIEFDIWTPSLGYGEAAHQLIKTNIVMDAFCGFARVINPNTVFLAGGNKLGQRPDSQRGTQIFDVKNNSFSKLKDLNYPRWYGSLIRTSDDKFIMVGGIDLLNDIPSTTPEILDLNSISDGWKILNKAESDDLFGNNGDNNEWYYPRSYLASDGNIVGISYNKIWKMDKNENYRISKTNELPLVKGGVANIIHTNPNQIEPNDHSEELRLLTIGSPLGYSNSTVMVGKDKVYIFGGKQVGEAYSSSNKVYMIDFSDSNYPKYKELESTNYPRANADATILPNGEIFLNGGTAYNDLKFSIFTPEIYNVNTQMTKTLSDGYFRRNYHSSTLLLPNGTLLITGGDVWNSEIFYPPYLFEKDENNKTVLAKRPLISKINKELKRGIVDIELDKNEVLDIEKITLISTGSTTHAQGSEPKFRSLEIVKKNKNNLSFKIPSNRNELQNGTYMIFAITNAGVPSKGEIIFLN